MPDKNNQITRKCPGVYTTPKGLRFDLGYIAKPEDMCGKMYPFRPTWNAQYLRDGTQGFFNTKKEAIAWMLEWDEIGGDY